MYRQTETENMTRITPYITGTPQKVLTVFIWCNTFINFWWHRVVKRCPNRESAGCIDVLQWFRDIYGCISDVQPHCWLSVAPIKIIKSVYLKIVKIGQNVRKCTGKNHLGFVWYWQKFKRTVVFYSNILVTVVSGSVHIFRNAQVCKW